MDNNTTLQVMTLIVEHPFVFLLLIIIVALLVLSIAYLFRDRLFDEIVKTYFDKQIKKELNTYKREVAEISHNQVISNNFKKESFLILNDKDGLIRNVAHMSNYTDIVLEKPDDVKLTQYTFVAFYISKRECNQERYDEYVKDVFSRLEKKNTMLLIYCEGFVQDRKENQLPEHYSFVNSPLTLIEKLESVYLIKKIMQLG